MKEYSKQRLENAELMTGPPVGSSRRNEDVNNLFKIS